MSKLAKKIIDALDSDGWLVVDSVDAKYATKAIDDAISGHTIKKSEIEHLRAKAETINKLQTKFEKICDINTSLHNIILTLQAENNILKTDIARRIDLDLKRTALAWRGATGYSATSATANFDGFQNAKTTNLNEPF